MSKVDIGTYHANPEQYQQLIEQLYADHPSITLPPEYAAFIQKDLVRFLIRLARYKFVARLVKKTDRVLEVGSGSGLGSMMIGQHCAHVTGIEVKKIEFEEARSINLRKNVEFELVDLYDLAVSRRYDVVLALDVIEHLPIEEGHQLVAAMARHLEPAGMLVIGTPSIYSYEYQSPLSKASHVKCYHQQELVDLIDHYCVRTLAFSMNDELVHTGHPKMAWYYFVLGLLPQARGA
jgi:SAM-dependent methyltransferase